MSSIRIDFPEEKDKFLVPNSSHFCTLEMSPFISNLVGLAGGLFRKPVVFPYKCLLTRCHPVPPITAVYFHLVLSGSPKVCSQELERPFWPTPIHQPVSFPLCSLKNWSMQVMGIGWLDPKEKNKTGFCPKFTFRRLLGEFSPPSHTPPPTQIHMLKPLTPNMITGEAL